MIRDDGLANVGIVLSYDYVHALVGFMCGLCGLCGESATVVLNIVCD